MTTQELLNKISDLSIDEQNAVAEFVKFLEQKKGPTNLDTRAVIDTFMNEHSDQLN